MKKVLNLMLVAALQVSAQPDTPIMVGMVYEPSDLIPPPIVSDKVAAPPPVLPPGLPPIVVGKVVPEPPAPPIIAGLPPFEEPSIIVGMPPAPIPIAIGDPLPPTEEPTIVIGMPPILEPPIIVGMPPVPIPIAIGEPLPPTEEPTIVIGMPPINIDCMCPKNYAPVCDTETGTTFGNACEARCAGVEEVSEGECKPPVAECMCPQNYAPVCDTETGMTFGNGCEARCAGVEEVSEGECKPQVAEYGAIHPAKSTKLCVDATSKRAKVKKCNGSDGQLFAVRDGFVKAKTGKCIGKGLKIVPCKQAKKVRFNNSQDNLKFLKKCLHYKGKGQKLNLKKCNKKKTQKFMHNLSEDEQPTVLK